MVETNPRLKKINLRHCKQITDESVRLIMENCTDLEELFLGFTAITDKSLGYLKTKEITIELDQCQNFSQRRFGSFSSSELQI